VESLGELERELLVVWDVSSCVDIRDQVVLLNVNGEDLSRAIDNDHTVSLGVSRGDEAELVSDLLSE
jgi:hypothetical protein